MGMRSGTQNVANIIGFGRAIDLVQKVAHQESERIRGLQNKLVDYLKSKKGIKLNGSMAHRLPNNINAIFSGRDNETLLMQLDEAGIMCASGSACNASSDELSETLLAIGLSQPDVRSSLRMTMGKFTSDSDIDYVIQILHKFSAR